jgi:hypothetical protein
MVKREALTITRNIDGYSAKLHGFPMWFEGRTYQEALSNAGKFLDDSTARADEIKKQMNQSK